jgi:tetratricopeptide (TPR) repeat protein
VAKANDEANGGGELTRPGRHRLIDVEHGLDHRLPNTTTDQYGGLAIALAHAARMLAARPDLAEQQAHEILKVAPGHPEALWLLAAARRGQGDGAGALAILQPLAASQPRAAAVHFELGLALGGLGRVKPAMAATERAVRLDPARTQAWRDLGDELTLAGETAAADAAYARHIQASVRDPKLLEAAAALCDGRLAVAEGLLRPHVKAHPTDVAAIRMLAEVGARLGRYEDSANLLARALELAPGFDAARHNHAIVLQRQLKAVEALAELSILLAREPRNPNYRILKAAALGQIGEYVGAIDEYAGVLKDYPNQPKGWMSYGHALKTVGRQAEAIAAYRKSIAMQPGLGEAYWSLANLKTVRFDAADVAAMRDQLNAEPDESALSDEDRFHLHFALGKALEDAADYAGAFDHYAAGNALRRKSVVYDADETSQQLRRSKALFTPAFFAERAGQGAQDADPIFVVGLPRAGSTLIEQILSSHSMVEGTMELPDIGAMVRRLGGKTRRDDVSAYPDVLTSLDAGALRGLGEEFLERTRIQRKQGRPFFIDKMPNNFAHVGLIHLILPNAKIIDARRYPLGCCFSGFKQHFARGQTFTYDLTDIGRYYADYVALMAHFDAVLPGRVHRVIYEAMVADPESQVRSLLDYCGLPFEAGCLAFHENDRAVRTASSEQVRRPIFTDGVDHWRHFEPWLGPLKSALGAVLDAYPATP